MDPITATLILGILEKIAIGAGVAVFLKLISKSPEAVRWLRRYLLGSNILVVGQAKAGKTSFYNYLKHGEFADTHPTHPTDRVSKPMRFFVNRGADLQFEIAKAFDIPGELPVSEQIDIVRRKRPKALLVFLSASLLAIEDVSGSVLSPEDWLRQFSSQLRDLLITESKVSKALRCFKVVLNKVDAVDEAACDKMCQTLQGVLRDELGEILGSALAQVKVLPCTLRKDRGGELLVKTLVLELVSCLRKNARLL